MHDSRRILNQIVYSHKYTHKQNTIATQIDAEHFYNHFPIPAQTPTTLFRNFYSPSFNTPRLGATEAPSISTGQ